MAEEFVDYSARNVARNLGKGLGVGIDKGFTGLGKVLENGIGNTLNAIAPIAAIAGDPLVALGIKGIDFGLKGVGKSLQLGVGAIKGVWGAEDSLNSFKDKIENFLTRSEGIGRKRDIEESKLLKARKVLLLEEQKILNELGEDDSDIVAELASINQKTQALDSFERDKQLEENARAINKNLRGSPPYLHTLVEYMEQFQYPLLEKMAQKDPQNNQMDRASFATGGLKDVIKEGFIGTWDQIQDSTMRQVNRLDSLGSDLYDINSDTNVSAEKLTSIEKILKTNNSEENTRERQRWQENLLNAFKRMGPGEGVEKPKKKGILSGLFDLFKTGMGAAVDKVKDVVGLATNLLPKPTIALPVGAAAKGGLAAWVAYSAYDTAMDAVAGWNEAEKHNVPKIVGAMSKAFGGSEGGGGTNALKKSFVGAGIGLGAAWATGLAIGAPLGPPGMIAGALIGGAIGGVTGWLGTKKIREGMMNMGESLSKGMGKLWNGVKEAWEINVVMPFESGMAKLQHHGGNLLDWAKDPFGMRAPAQTQGMSTYQQGLNNSQLKFGTQQPIIVQSSPTSMVNNNYSSTTRVSMPPTSHDPTFNQIQVLSLQY